MEELEKKRLAWQKIQTCALLAVLVLMLCTAGGILYSARMIGKYESRVDNILTRMEAVTVELEELDTETLVSTVNGVSSQLQEADLKSTLDSLQSVSAQLDAVDWKELAESIDAAADQAETTLTQAEKTLEVLQGTLQVLNLNALNQTIQDLKTAVEPLTEFAALFKR